MRKNKISNQTNDISILAVDDDTTMTLTLQTYFQSSGYRIDVENDPWDAIERVKNGAYEILLLDFLLTPICGDKVIEEIRKFNCDIYIIMLTGHKNMLPPIRTMREMAIQGYFEKSNRIDQLELLVESCVKSIRQMKALKHYETGLQHMLTLIPSIYHQQKKEDVYQMMLSSACEIMKSKRSFVALDKPDKDGLCAEDFDFSFYGACDVLEIKGIVAQIGCSKSRKDFFEIGQYIIVPIVKPDHTRIAFLGAVLHRELQEQDRQLFAMLGRQFGSALDNIFLHIALNEKNSELKQTNELLRGNYMDMISALRSTVDAKDVFTRGHSDRVSYYAGKLAKALCKSEEFVERIRIAGLFHDIGKISISDDILMKEGELTEEEYQKIKCHSENGEKILSAISQLSDILPAVRGHHERYDGSGYPDGLKGEMIPEEARIIAVADAFDAMISDRRYRFSMSIDMAIDELKKGRGRQFDGEIVDAFLPLIYDFDKVREEMKGEALL